MDATICLQEADFDAADEVAALTRGRVDIGAVVTFTGICRGSEAGAPVAAMTLEHYPGMAEKELAPASWRRRARWPLLGVTVPPLRQARAGRQYRAGGHGGLPPAAAFEAAEFLMDYLKTSAPFWKREERPDGAQWVDAKSADDSAADRWAAPGRAAE